MRFGESKEQNQFFVKDTYSDKEILERYSISREEGFRLLVVTYRERLYYHIRRLVILHHDSDDALQNTLIKAWNNIDNFRNDSSLYTWLYRIATNEALVQLKKMKRLAGVKLDSIELFFASSEEGDIYFDGDEAEQKLQNAILTLPEKQRIVFQMRYYDELPYEEISRILGTSKGALKASYHHAVKKIEDFFERN